MEMDKVQALLSRHEAFKAKWLFALNYDDVFNWLQLKDEMIILSSQLKSEYMENEIKWKAKRGTRMIELKLMTNELWKKTHTDSTAEGVIRQEMLDSDLQQAMLKTSYELLYEIAQWIESYTQIVKAQNKALFTV